MKKTRRMIALILMVLLCLATVPMGIFAKDQLEIQVKPTENEALGAEKEVVENLDAVDEKLEEVIKEDVDTDRNNGKEVKEEASFQARANTNNGDSLEKVNSTGLKINHEILDLSLERSEKLVITDSAGQEIKVTWSSDNPKVASIDDTGYVCGNYEGTANITAMTENGNQKFSCKVTVYGFTFEVYNGKAKVVQYNGMGGNIVVPATFNGDPVEVVSFTSHGEPKLEQPIRGIVFSEGIENLSEVVFYGTPELESVEFPSTFKGDYQGKVNIGNTKIKNLDGFKKVTQLKELLAYSNKQLTDISGIVENTNLKRVDFTNTSVSDITVLSNLSNLTRVGLGHTPVSDASPLADLKNLTDVSLDGTNVSDVSFFKDKGLEYLILQDSKVSDADKLSFITVSDLTYYTASDRSQEYLLYGDWPIGILPNANKGLSVESENPNLVEFLPFEKGYGFNVKVIQPGQTTCKLKLNDATTETFTLTVVDARVEHVYSESVLLEVVIPNDAVPDGYHVQIDSVTLDKADEAEILNSYPNAEICNFFELSMVNKNGDKITTFNKPLTIRIRMPEDIDNPKKLTFIYLGEKGPETLKTVICLDGYAEYQIDHFSKYALIKTEKENPTTVIQTKTDPIKPEEPTKPENNNQSGNDGAKTDKNIQTTTKNNGSNPATALTTQEKVSTMLVMCTVTVLCALAIYSIKRRQAK